MRTSETTRLDLSNISIDQFASVLQAALSKFKMTPKDVRRYCLAVEELLLNWQTQLGAQAECALTVGNRFLSRRPFVRITAKGAKADPTRTDDSELYSGWLSEYQLLGRLGVTANYGYRGGVNEVKLYPDVKRINPLISLACIVALAVTAGLLLSLLPDATRATVSQRVIAPFFSTLMNLLSTIASPMIFLAVCSGIYSIGDIATVGKIGKRLIGGFVAKTYLVLAGTLLLTCWFFPIVTTGGGMLSGSSASAIYQMLLDIVPRDIFSPFVNGNALQIIFLATACGIGILLVGRRASSLIDVVDQIHSVVKLLMSAIGRLVPLFVFTSVLNFMLANELSQLAGLGKQFIFYAILVIALMLSYVLAVSIRLKVPPKRFIMKLMPTFLVALSTASSAAAFNVNMETCKGKLGVPDKVAEFGVPLGQVLYMPCAAFSYLISAMCIAEIYGVAMSPVWLLVAAVVSGILAIATPPIPGGMLSCFTILFIQLGIPAEGVALAISIALVMDYVFTATDLFCLQAELTLQTGKMDMLDKDKLHA